MKFMQPPRFGAFKIIGHNPREVLLLADFSQLVEGSRDFYRFSVRKIGAGWYIDRVDRVTRTDWLRS